jgi:flagellin-like protein
MNRYRKNDKAVSPVIATILMVAITVVLAGVLVVYLQTLPQGAGSVETNIGIRAEKIANGTTNDSLITITTGSAKTTDMSVVVTNPTTGAQAVRKTMTSPFATQANADVDFNDNNGNGKIDAGDTILVHGTGVGFSDYKFSLVRGDNTLATRTLP